MVLNWEVGVRRTELKRMYCPSYFGGGSKKRLLNRILPFSKAHEAVGRVAMLPCCWRAN